MRDNVTDPIRVLAIDGYLDALSPIQHGGDEKTGSTPVLRSLTFWDPTANAHVRLPFLAGNAIRGMLRRLVMHDLVASLGYAVASPKLHHALFTGGSLEGTDESAGKLDLAYRRRVRDLFPPLALFGTVLGNQMIPGCLRVDQAMPLCAEWAWAAPSTRRDDPRCRHSVRTFTDVAFATRRDDLRAEREKDEQATQMLIEFEAFIAGTRFAHGFTLVYPSALEVSCLGHALALWAEQPFVGGKSGSGYGRVALAYAPVPDPAPYRAYVAEHVAALRAGLDEIAARLATAPKPAKRAGPERAKDGDIDAG